MEITAPGGNLEKIRYAVLYGADAVYGAYEKFGLRAFAGNLSKADILEAVNFCHLHNAKFYLTLNVYARNADLGDLEDFVQWLSTSKIDAVIVSDPGVFQIVRKNTDLPIHISTQANTTNLQAARFWHDLGARRIIPARELSFTELLEIKQGLPELELEAFIHGAMCISWSGRCLLSAALNNRSANYGECTHPCRWNWALTEESRPGEFFPIEEDQYGTYVLSSKDLCLLDEIPRLKAAGINSGKIEGRMKSLYYVAQLARIYKKALSENLSVEDWNVLYREADKVSHRPYYKGFMFGFDQDTVNQSIADTPIQESAYNREWQFCAKNLRIEADGLLHFDCLSKLCAEEELEIIFPKLEDDVSLSPARFICEDGSVVFETKPNKSYAIEISAEVSPHGIIRKPLYKI